MINSTSWLLVSIWMTFIRHQGASQTVVIYKSILTADRFKQQGDDEAQAERKQIRHTENSVHCVLCKNEKTNVRD